ALARPHHRGCTIVPISAQPRLKTYLRGQRPARLVPRGGGRAVQDSVAVDLPGSPRAGIHLLVSVGRAVMTLIAPTLQAFFTDRLIQQRQASPQTIAAYRDTLRLLLTFVQQRTGKMPA